MRSSRLSMGLVAMVLLTGPAVMLTEASAAQAAPPVGTCTSSYAPYTYDMFSFDPAAQAIFAVIDANHDGIVCFKYYPNGPHNGHIGNLVDDKAAPHT